MPTRCPIPLCSSATQTAICKHRNRTNTKERKSAKSTVSKEEDSIVIKEVEGCVITE